MHILISCKSLQINLNLKLLIILLLASLMAKLVKNLPAVQETQVQSLGWEDPLGEGNGNPLQYSCLENSMDKEA